MGAASPERRPVPNTVFRQLRGRLSPGEYAAAVRKAAREIGERVSCDARYVGRVEAGEIRCPNYAYERVFLHMYPGLTLVDLGFTAREAVRGGARARRQGAQTAPADGAAEPAGAAGAAAAPAGADGGDGRGGEVAGGAAEGGEDRGDGEDGREGHGRGDEESDVLRRAFMTGGSAAVAAASFGLGSGLGLGTVLRSGSGNGDGSGDGGGNGGAGAAGVSLPGRRRVGEAEAAAVEEAVRRIRVLDDRHGADGLYRRAAQPLRAAYALLDSGICARDATSARLHAGAGELALSVGWLAHDSGRFDDARSHYAEALATARVAGDAALEAHAFSNTSFLARDAGRHREAVRAAQAGQRAAQGLGSARLLSLLALREAGGWAGLGDRGECERSLGRAHSCFDRGPGAADPEWMSFFGQPESEALQAQCWAALGDWVRAARHSRRAASLQDRRFTRNLALYRAELAVDLAHAGALDEAAAAAQSVLDLLHGVQSSRIHSMLRATATTLRPHRASRAVSAFLGRHAVL